MSNKFLLSDPELVTLLSTKRAARVAQCIINRTPSCLWPWTYDTMDSDTATALQNVRDLPENLISAFYNMLILAALVLPLSFWDSYNEDKKILRLRLCLLLWIASGLKFMPREFQLKATIALLSGQDVLVDVGTPCLLYPATIDGDISVEVLTGCPAS